MGHPGILALTLVLKVFAPVTSKDSSPILVTKTGSPVRAYLNAIPPKGVERVRIVGQKE